MARDPTFDRTRRCNGRLAKNRQLENSRKMYAGRRSQALIPGSIWTVGWWIGRPGHRRCGPRSRLDLWCCVPCAGCLVEKTFAPFIPLSLSVSSWSLSVCSARSLLSLCFFFFFSPLPSLQARFSSCLTTSIISSPRPTPERPRPSLSRPEPSARALTSSSRAAPARFVLTHNFFFFLVFFLGFLGFAAVFLWR